MNEIEATAAQQLLARQHCTDLVLASLDAVDQSRYSRLLDVYSIDATLTRPDGSVLCGSQAIAAAYAARPAQRLTRHVVSNHMVSVHLPTKSATSNCTITLWVGDASTQPSARGRLCDGPLQLGAIQDTLCLAQEGWRIQHRVASFSLFTR